MTRQFYLFKQTKKKKEISSKYLKCGTQEKLAR